MRKLDPYSISDRMVLSEALFRAVNILNNCPLKATGTTICEYLNICNATLSSMRLLHKNSSYSKIVDLIKLQRTIESINEAFPCLHFWILDDKSIRINYAEYHRKFVLKPKDTNGKVRTFKKVTRKVY